MNLDNFNKYGQYKYDIFTKLNFPFIEDKKILDIGCGDGTDAEIFIKEYKLKCYGTDIYKHENINNIAELNFVENKECIYKLTYENEYFDYVFMHDVLHHIDEKTQAYENHIKGLNEIKKVCKKGGYLIIIEGNRYNPLFFIHMVKLLGHEHFKQSYFNKIIKNVFTNDNINFKYFEAHLYPKRWLWFWKVYEKIMEKIIPVKLLAYNCAIIEKIKD